MKNKIAQLIYSVNGIDRNYIKFAYFMLIFAVALVHPCPADGGTGPI